LYHCSIVYITLRAVFKRKRGYFSSKDETLWGVSRQNFFFKK